MMDVRRQLPRDPQVAQLMDDGVVTIEAVGLVPLSRIVLRGVTHAAAAQRARGGPPLEEPGLGLGSIAHSLNRARRPAPLSPNLKARRWLLLLLLAPVPEKPRSEGSTTRALRLASEIVVVARTEPYLERVGLAVEIVDGQSVDSMRC
eukprot:scaffold96234_cov57-Phaeocystis_antarctica.AAC.2